MKMTLIRVLTVAGLLAVSSAAHASQLMDMIWGWW
jgi:hypothetical protein